MRSDGQQPSLASRSRGGPSRCVTTPRLSSEEPSSRRASTLATHRKGSRVRTRGGEREPWFSPGGEASMRGKAVGKGIAPPRQPRVAWHHRRVRAPSRPMDPWNGMRCQASRDRRPLYAKQRAPVITSHELLPSAGAAAVATRQHIATYTPSSRLWATCLGAARRLAWRGALVAVGMPRPVRIALELSRDSHRADSAQRQAKEDATVPGASRLARARAAMCRHPATSEKHGRLKTGRAPVAAWARPSGGTPTIQRGGLTLITGVDDAVLVGAIATGMHRLVLSLLSRGGATEEAGHATSGRGAAVGDVRTGEACTAE